MRELLRAITITAFVAGSAQASFMGYELLAANVDSLFLGTYDSANFAGNDQVSSSLRNTMDEVRGNYQAAKRSSDATSYSADIYTP
jgi:hypothetical protein